MKCMIVLFSLAAIAMALPVDQPEPLPFQYSHTSDVDGSYSFSYSDEDSSKTETRSADGTVVGGYQYIDSDGILQKIQYQAGEGGVQLVGSNLPVGSTEPVQHTPEVIKATEEHFHEVQRAMQLIAKAAALEAEYKKKHPELA